MATDEEDNETLATLAEKYRRQKNGKGPVEKKDEKNGAKKQISEQELFITQHVAEPGPSGETVTQQSGHDGEVMMERICMKVTTTKSKLDKLRKYNYKIAVVSYGKRSLSWNKRSRGTTGRLLQAYFLMSFLFIESWPQETLVSSKTCFFQ